MVEDKISAIRSACEPVVGSTIERFETAQLLHDDGTWSDWHDLPIRIYCSGGRILSISWSRFDDLWLSDDTSLPFDTKGLTVRWTTNGLPQIRGAVGKVIHGVMLGRGEMTMESQPIPVWTRLFVDLNMSWLEIFNALDENGYELHSSFPELVDLYKCV